MDSATVVYGQVFPRAILKRIKAAVRDHPEWSRADLARQVCRWLNWRAANGKDKALACRVALLRLERRGLIDLPPARRSVRFGARSFAQTQLSVPSKLEGTLQELRGLKLILVTSKDRELDRQWKKLVATHHYLGYHPLCGAQVRYLIACEHGYLGALGFSAAALYLKARERWIGWSHAARQCHLPLVVANSRFVIARGVRVKNLASKVLALAHKRLPQDWAQAYGYKPLLLETYVESKRFAATSYRAANWIRAGQTCGRGRQDRERTKRSKTFIFTHWLPTAKSVCARSQGRHAAPPSRALSRPSPHAIGLKKSSALCGCAIDATASACFRWRVIFLPSPQPIFRRPVRAAPKPKQPIDFLSTRR
jgi:hypothetical protein